jgi:hypothetical protein
MVSIEVVRPFGVTSYGDTTIGRTMRFFGPTEFSCSR